MTSSLDAVANLNNVLVPINNCIIRSIRGGSLKKCQIVQEINYCERFGRLLETIQIYLPCQKNLSETRKLNTPI